MTGEQIPVWATDYVLADYGTGAVMGVPGGDQRDWEFATVMGLPIVRTTQPPADFEGEAYTGEGATINSPAPGEDAPLDINGLPVAEAKSTDHRVPGGPGDRAGARSTSGCATGCCPASATGARRSRSSTARSTARSPVPEDQLPVTLPMLRGADLKPKGTSPLGGADGVGQRRLPDVRRPGDARHRHDGHLRRLVLVHVPLLLAARRHPAVRLSAMVNAWMPCNLYVGGVEHAVLHLLYGRFFTKVLNDMGLVDFREPLSA